MPHGHVGLLKIYRGVLDALRRHEEALFDYAVGRLGGLRGVKICAPSARGSVLSFNLAGIPSDSVANALGKAGICVRGGFHCSPLAHGALGTGEYGSVRVSFGYFNTRSDIDAMCDALIDQFTDPSFTYSGLTGESSWSTTGEVTKTPTAVIIENGVYVGFNK